MQPHRTEETEAHYLAELVGEHGWRWVITQPPERKAEILRELEAIAAAQRELFFDQHRNHAAIFETPERQREIELEMRKHIADRATFWNWYHIKPLLGLLVGFLVFLLLVRIFDSGVIIALGVLVLIGLAYVWPFLDGIVKEIREATYRPK